VLNADSGTAMTNALTKASGIGESPLSISCFLTGDTHKEHKEQIAVQEEALNEISGSEATIRVLVVFEGGHTHMYVSVRS
jgi:hypothetical protein